MEKSVDSFDLKNQFENYFYKVAEEKRIRLGLVNDSDFMLWLHASLCSNKTVIYSDGEIVLKENELKTNNQLAILFELVKEYANRHYIVSNVDNKGTSYYIKYNNLLMRIGFKINRFGPVYFAIKVVKTSDKIIPIDFDNIKQEEIGEQTIAKEKKALVELYNFIRNLKATGFTDEDIIYTTSKALKYVK